VAAGLTAFLVWPAVLVGAYEAPVADLWASVDDASWIGLDDGLISGSFGLRSSLAVQLFHVFSPITGLGPTGARTASMLVGVLAIVAIYVLGHRVAGVVGAVTAVTAALLTEPFRTSLSTGSSTGTLVLAACIFLIAVHNVLLRPDRMGMVLLGIAGAMAILAEPLWWIGVVAAIVLLSLRNFPRGAVVRALVAALAALAVVSLPNRVSVARQADGDLNADVVARATIARNVEFVGRGHGAPPDQEALSANPTAGKPIGLFGYLFGEHTPTKVAGGALNGAYDGLEAAAERTETTPLGVVAFIAELVGVLFLLLVPGLRLLVLVPAMLAVVPWFLAGHDVIGPFIGLTAFWPAMLVGAAAVGFAVHGALRDRVRMPAAVTSALHKPAGVMRRGGRRGAPARR
jgi:hypothetical protein